MSSPKTKALLLMSSALVAAVLLAPRSPAVAERSDVLELLDPAAVAASACGLGGRQAGALKPGATQIALVSPADGVADAGDGPPLWEGLGDLSYAVSTGNETAQAYFDQGLRLTYAFNHAEAYRAFKKAQALDPGCAMCFWGEAFVLGANINAGMEADAVKPAFIAALNASRRAAGASGAEQALIAALAKRYASGPDADAGALAAAYADAMAEAHARFPDDLTIAVLFADAVMNTTPWDYWEADGLTPKGRIGEAIAAIEGVLRADPDHSGAIHLYIHLTEASKAPEKAEPFAERLGATMPAAGHIVHMPSHTYYRLGRYKDSLESNIAAVKADEAYLAQVEAAGIYPNGYYPHNIHFALVSAFMAGDAESAAWAAERLEGKVKDEVARDVGWIQLIKQGPYLVHAHMSDAAKVLALPEPSVDFPLVRAAWHYARGIAHARAGDTEAARREAALIAEINQANDPDTAYPGDVAFIARDILSIARHVVEARVRQAEGDLEGAIAELRVAVQIQDTLAYLEPPFWYYPVRQTLGATLLAAGRPEAAAKVFFDSLVDAPNNGWALYGLMAAQKAQGDEAAAAVTEKLFEKAWAGDDMPDLARL